MYSLSFSSLVQSALLRFALILPFALTLTSLFSQHWDSKVQELVSKQKIEKAIRIAEIKLQNAEEKLSSQEKAFLFCQLSELHNHIGNMEIAQEFAMQGLTLLPELKDSILITRLKIIYAYIQFNLGQLDSAIEFAEEGIAFAEKSTNPDLLRSASTVMSLVHMINKLPEKSFPYAQNAYVLSGRKDLSFFRSYDAFWLGANFLAVGKNDSAFAYIQQGFTFAKAAKDSISLSKGYATLAYYYLTLGDQEKAKATVLEGMAFAKAIPFFRSYFTLGCNLLTLYNVNASYEQAIDLGKDLQLALDTTKIPFGESYLYELLYQANKGKGDYEGALVYLEKLFQIQQTLFTDRQNSKIFQLQLNNDLRKKDVTILGQELQIAKTRKKTIILYALNGLFLLAGLGFWIIQRMKKKFRRKIYEKEKQHDDILEEKNRNFTPTSSYKLISSLSVVEENETSTFEKTGALDFSEEQRKTLYQEMLIIVEEQKLYLNPDLNKKLILSLLGTNRQYLYEAISQNSGDNFKQIINHFRIKEAKKRIEWYCQNKNGEIPINIFEEAGFNSLSSYHRIFRTSTGLTPKEYAIEYIQDLKNINNSSQNSAI